MTDFDEYEQRDADYRGSRGYDSGYDGDYRQSYSRSPQTNRYRGGREPDYADRYEYARSDYDRQDYDDPYYNGRDYEGRGYGYERANRYQPRNARQSGGFGSMSDNAKVNLLIGGCVALVLLALLICVLIQRCDSCGGRQEMPVVEQGDGTWEPSYSDAIEEPFEWNEGETQPTDAQFEVTVRGADGTYSRTGVKRDEAASLVVSEQNETGFSFALTVNGGTLNGAAYFISADTAVCEATGARINFRFGQDEIFVEETDSVSSFGGKSCSGVYTAGDPHYNDETAETTVTTGSTAANSSNYDANVKDSEAVKKALDSILPESDKALMKSIFADGTSAVQQGAAGQGKDKNGKDINIDRELDAVKYYVFVPYSGEELMMICKNDGKVYVGICDGGEYRYYTNDPAYKSKAPQAIIGQADVKGMKLVYK